MESFPNSMKILASISLAVVVAGLAGFLVASNRASSKIIAAQAEAGSAMKAARKKMDAELAKASRTSVQVERITNEVEVASGVTPGAQAFIDRIIELVNEPEQRRSIQRRQIVHQFESIVDLQASALQGIKRYIDRNEDVHITGKSEPAENKETTATKTAKEAAANAKLKGRLGDRFAEWRRTLKLGLPNGEYDVPPTLRLGLFESTYRIGGDDAEKILVASLTKAARGVEVATIVAWLEKLSPGKHRELAVSVARARLNNPIEITDGVQDDRLSRTYLFSVLAHFGDTSILNETQLAMITPEGKLDHTVIGFVAQTMKDQLMPLIAGVYADPNLEDPLDRRRLVGMSQSHFGTDPQANDIFRSLISATTREDAFTRYFAIASLDGGGFREYGWQPVPDDPNVIQARIELLNSVMNEELSLDPKTTGLMEQTYNNLVSLSNGEDISEQSSRFGKN